MLIGANNTTFLEWLDSACDWPAQLKTQSAQREDVFLPALHVDWRLHLVNRPLCDDDGVDQCQIGFRVKAQSTRRSDASLDR